MKVAVFGARGFVGRQIVRGLSDYEDVEVVEVTRDSSPWVHPWVLSGPVPVADVYVNAACPGARLRAEQQPDVDFVETVTKTQNLLNGYWGRFVQISSLSARAQLDTVYGRHRLAAEALCSGDTAATVIRLGPMYGEGLVKGPLIDMLTGRMVYAHPDSKYGYAPVEWIGRRVAKMVVEPSPGDGLVELAGTGYVTLRECADAIGSNCLFDEDRRPDDQWVDWPTVGDDVQATLMWADPDVPSATSVLTWLKEQRDVPAE
jgi:nucleoside-diphosphate-sugar epimerase